MDVPCCVQMRCYGDQAVFEVDVDTEGADVADLASDGEGGPQVMDLQQLPPPAAVSTRRFKCYKNPFYSMQAAEHVRKDIMPKRVSRPGHQHGVSRKRLAFSARRAASATYTVTNLCAALEICTTFLMHAPC